MPPAASASTRPAIVSAAFYLILVLGILYLLISPWNPAGFIQGPLFLIAALGIRRNLAWRAYGLALFSLAWTVVPLGSSFERLRPQTSLLLVAGLFTLGIALALFLAARTIERQYGRRGRAWPWILASAFALVFVPFAFMMVPTGSMEDTLMIGDRVAVLKTFGRPPARGQLVAHYYPVNRKEIFIKRVVGLPGDRIRIQNKHLFVNDQAVAEPYAVHKTAYYDSYRDNFPGTPDFPLLPQAQDMLDHDLRNDEVQVPPGRYFVLGDNRDSSLDSRYWGFIELSDIIGTPKVVYYSIRAPAEHLTVRPRILRLGTIRWGRTFHIVS